MADDDYLWYKDAIIYEVHVRSFYDADGDGIGDLRGLTEKLDYIEKLGVTALWLLPFYPSPLKDDGYDIAGYTEVHPDYGTLQDFRELLTEAHRRGLKVITELVLNHTSDQHPWFQRARRAPKGSKERDFYVWSDDPNKYKEARIIFADTKNSNWSWDPIAQQYFWHRFYAHQPDLNFDNPDVQEAVFKVVDFWLEMGIDGMRLDAITYLYEREGTNCESLPETHAFLKKLRTHIDHHFSDRMLLAEANQWPEEAADYFGDGEECHMTFHFPLMPRLFTAVQMEDRFSIVDILEQTPDIAYESQWAVFLRNHDELTLEMVTDEERDLMYRAFAPETRMRINLGIRRRLAPLLNNDRRKIQLMYSILFSLAGTPILYYGDELGMGDNYHLGDRDGVRTPMQWEPAMNAGFSSANPQSLYLPVIIDPEYHYISTNVMTQESNPLSLLQWVKRLISIRKRYRAFGRGDLHFVANNNQKVLAFVRCESDEIILSVANLSRSVQHVVIDLERFEGLWPLELWGRTEFPQIRGRDYPMTLGPYGSYWFSLQRVQPTSAELAVPSVNLKRLDVHNDWTSAFDGRLRDPLNAYLASFLLKQAWFLARGRRIDSVEINEKMRMRHDDKHAFLCFVDVRFLNGDNEMYVVPIGYATGQQQNIIARQTPDAVIAPVFIQSEKEDGILFDAVVDSAFSRNLLGHIRRGWSIQGKEGTLQGEWIETSDSLIPQEMDRLEPTVYAGDINNTTIVYGTEVVVQLTRRLERGESLDVEMGRYLNSRNFPYSASLRGSMDYRRGRWEPTTVAVVHDYVDNRYDGWKWAVNSLQSFFERIPDLDRPLVFPTEAGTDYLMRTARQHPTAEVDYLMGATVARANLLGNRIARLHEVLAAATGGSDFDPEPITPSYERARYQSMRTLTVRTIRQLQRKFDLFPARLQEPVRQIIESRERMLDLFRGLIDAGIDGLRTRIHGDLHLRDLLVTQDNDFMIIDLEGHPWLPIGERRIKRSPLWDVASMIRSFHNVSLLGLQDISTEIKEIGHGSSEIRENLTRYWFDHASAAFLHGYLEYEQEVRFLPSNSKTLATLLDALMLEKALHHLDRELRQDLENVAIPVSGILALLR